MDIKVRTEGPWAPESFSWLGSRHGTDSTDSITLLASLFAANFAARGYIPGGVALGKVTASGFYGPYDDAASDGRQVMVGFLFTSKSLAGGGTNIGAALLSHGKVRVANLPLNHGLDTAGRTDVAGRILFI